MTRSYSALVPSPKVTATRVGEQVQRADLGAVPDLAAGAGEQHPVQVGPGQRPALADAGPEGVEVDLAELRAGGVEEALAVDDLAERADRAVQVEPAQRAGGVAGQVEAGLGELPRGQLVGDVRPEARQPQRPGHGQTGDARADDEDAQGGATHGGDASGGERHALKARHYSERSAHTRPDRPARHRSSATRTAWPAVRRRP